jgi:hypothetical protein
MLSGIRFFNHLPAIREFFSSSRRLVCNPRCYAAALTAGTNRALFAVSGQHAFVLFHVVVDLLEILVQRIWVATSPVYIAECPLVAQSGHVDAFPLLRIAYTPAKGEEASCYG